MIHKKIGKNKNHRLDNQLNTHFFQIEILFFFYVFLVFLLLNKFVVLETFLDICFLYSFFTFFMENNLAAGQDGYLTGPRQQLPDAQLRCCCDEGCGGCCCWWLTAASRNTSLTRCRRWWWSWESLVTGPACLIQTLNR